MIKTMLLLLLFTGATSGGSSDFDRLKTLVGEWEANSPEGKSAISFQLTANGTALMETLTTGPTTMVTLYHPDGDGTMMTHYCAIGNQPRMRAQRTSDGKSITFNFVDAANLKDASAGHMSRLVIRLQDADNIIEEWTWKENGKEQISSFNLRRVKK
jgi:hypothetical protein